MKYFYLIQFQYLGFRYHGWQKQSIMITVQSTIESNIEKVLKHKKFQTLGASRTDSMVSAETSVFELIVEEELNENFLNLMNLKLPQDIRLLSCKSVDKSFRIIGAFAKKEYHYYFSFGQKPHPFSAPFIAHFNENLDIAKMQKAASFFIGKNFFHNYCHKDRIDNFNKEIFICEIIPNEILVANFFPKESYVLRIHGTSFMRHQIRLMMGALLRVGLNQLQLKDLEKSLLREINQKEVFLAPSAGLCLYRLE